MTFARRRAAPAAAALMLLAAFASPAPAQQRPRFDAAAAPSAAEIIRALIGAQALPIDGAPRCRGAAGDEAARDLGDYVASLAALLTEGTARNWIATTAERGSDPAHGGAVWHVGVSFHRSGGDEDWAWGARFALRADDHTLVPGTIACMGMG